MKLESLDNKVLILNTDKRGNSVEFDSSEDLNSYNRRDLSFYETF